MAQFDKVNGDYQPVVVMDSGVVTGPGGAGWNSGLNAVVSGATVQPQGPKLDYWTVEAADGTHFSGDQVNVIVQTVQQLATVYIYQYNSDTTDSFAFAAYPTGAWNMTVDSINNLQDNLRAALTSASLANAVVVTSGATFAG